MVDLVFGDVCEAAACDERFAEMTELGLVPRKCTRVSQVTRLHTVIRHGVVLFLNLHRISSGNRGSRYKTWLGKEVEMLVEGGPSSTNWTITLDDRYSAPTTKGNHQADPAPNTVMPAASLSRSPKASRTVTDRRCSVSSRVISPLPGPLSTGPSSIYPEQSMTDISL